MTDAGQQPAQELKPLLRFPEFGEQEGWKTLKLEDVSIPVTERVGERKLVPVSISAGTGFVAQAEKFGRDISGNQYRLYTVVRDGDFVYNKGNSVRFPQGCIYQLQGWGEVAAPNVFICFRLKKGYVNDFFQYCFEKNIHGLQLKKHITSGARSNGLLNISKQAFFGIEIPLPRADEQRKIADCLSSIDELIQSETKKLSALAAYKKGLMQRLFPRQGESVPRLRFPEFENTGEWKKQKISALLRKVSNPVEVDPDRMYQQIGIRSHGKGIFHKELVSGKELGNKRVFWVEDGAFIVNIVFAWEQAVATTSSEEKGMIASHRFPMFKAKAGKAYVPYIKHFFLTKQGKHLLLLASPGGAGRNRTLGQKEFENLEFLAPETVEEQTKIADFLASMDSLIGEQERKLEAVKRHKAGLMQQLFPPSDWIAE